MIGPSLSVVHTVPSSRKKLAPALSSPPKHHDPSNNPGTNHLNPTGTSENLRPSFSTTRSIKLLLTSVFPTINSFDHFGRCVSRYRIATARKWFGFINPAAGVTTP